MLLKNPTNNSLYIFSKKNLIRKLCFNISSHPLFDKIVLFFIITSTLKLALETFYDTRDKNLNDIKSKNLKRASKYLSFTINIFFTFVIILKIISVGFFLKPKSFCKDKLNIINLFAVLGFYMNLIFKGETNLQIFFQVFFLLLLILQ